MSTHIPIALLVHHSYLTCLSVIHGPGWVICRSYALQRAIPTQASLVVAGRVPSGTSSSGIGSDPSVDHLPGSKHRRSPVSDSDGWLPNRSSPEGKSFQPGKDFRLDCSVISLEPCSRMRGSDFICFSVSYICRSHTEIYTINSWINTPNNNLTFCTAWCCY